jgi:hypothetical protein
MSTPRNCSGLIAGVCCLLAAAGIVRAADGPTWLPCYDLDIHFQLDQHQALVRERITWTNRHPCQVKEIVFNAHANFKLADKDVGFLAKTVELLRLAPSEAMDFEGNACQVQKATFISHAGPVSPANGSGPPEAALELPFHYQEDNPTALVVPLPRPVGVNESVTIELQFIMRLPPKQGRWGQWKGVTFLAQWLPVVAYHDLKGWQPTPFIPWHQPFFNEAGNYTARITLPCDQKLACTASVAGVRDLGNGMQQVELAPCCARDFAVFCSDRYHEYVGYAGPVKVRCVAFPEHEFYAREMVRIACEAIPVYSKWFGDFPYPEFTIVESYFGWNGNECGGLVMIDERIFDMPHLAVGFVDSLVSHEICHQWWYNAVGTNGYCETWMDEGLATYFSHRLMDLKHGKNNGMLTYPKGLTWLPNIYRDDYRHYSLYGTLGRGENCATVQDMPGFSHLVNLNSMCYDKGSKIVGMIEERLGEAAFLDFMRHVYHRYRFCILRVADFQHELEAYTGTSWDEFFKGWLYGKGLSDWCLEKVKIEKLPACTACGTDPTLPAPAGPRTGFLDCLRRPVAPQPCRATIFLQQKAEINEPTVLGICLDGSDKYQLRIPIILGTRQMQYDDPPATVLCLPDNRVRVDVTLPAKPTQIAVDPDQILVDKNPCNNTWKTRARIRVTPLYTLLDDTDLTNRYDRWNCTIGPWIYGGGYNDPWFTRSEMIGLRAGIYRMQEFAGGGYLAYRTDDRNIVAGVDGLWDHWPLPHTQVGFVAERSLTTANSNGGNYNRAAVFGRYIMAYGSSLYLPPINYVEVFGSVQEDALPNSDQFIPGTDHFDQQTTAGVHYHIDYRTPYWDPEGGFLLDATYQTGIPIFGEHRAFNQVFGQFSYIKSMPELAGPEVLAPVLHWFSQTRLAFRAFGAGGLPDDGEYFALGGGLRFRGFDLAQRQGSVVWVGSVEWRVPLAKGMVYDCCDHVAGLRNIYAAAFYDAGNAYVNGHQTGDVAHAVGGGLRLDVAWFGLIERTTLRFDVAKTVNANTPVQFWFGIQHPF